MKRKKLITLLCVFSLILLAVILLSGIHTIFRIYNVAYANSSVEVIKAPVSNLEGNEYAGKSSLSIYSKDNETKFYLPESYFLLSPTAAIGEYYEVTYAGERFYMDKADVHTSQVVFSDGELTSPDVTLTVNDDQTVTLSGVQLTSEHTVKLLGYSEDGTQVYVSAQKAEENKLFGFLNLTDVVAFNVPYQAKTQAERDAIIAEKLKPHPEDGDIVPNTSVALRIVIIVGIAVPAMIVMLLLFKPQKGERRYKEAPRPARAENNYDNSRTFVRNDNMQRPNSFDPSGTPYPPRNGAQGNYPPNGYDDRYDDRR